MVITDHLNFTGVNPLTGPNDETIGPRFPDMSRAYDPALLSATVDAARDAGVPLHAGIYAGVAGPSLETSAERRYFRAAGGDAVGMSTVHEVIAAAHVGLVIDAVYRAPDNPLIASLYDKRKPHPDATMFPKGSAGARGVMDALKRGRPLGLLIDQKMNDGIEARFFGRKAMTTPAFAQLARRFDCPIVAVRIERLEGVRFRVTAYEGVRVAQDGKAADDIAATVQQFNDLLEGWIRERPEQWLWVHRRWPKEE
jgi:hypothetical protein